jgi:chaperone modulatory protein CbpM
MLREQDLLSIVTETSETELRVSLAAGWIVPASSDGERRYAEIDAARLRLIHELRADLDLSDEAVSVVLSLLDQLHELRVKLSCVAETIDAQPDDIRARLVETLVERFGKANKRPL